MKSDAKKYPIQCERCKAGDPRAAYCAKSFSEKSGSQPDLNPVQAKILQSLKETCGIGIQELSGHLELPLEAFERDIAALRHMEKLRAEMREGRKKNLPVAK